MTARVDRRKTEASLPRRNLSFTDAAERILSESENQEPLHYKTITQRAIDQGLIRTEGRTPAASMYAMVWGEVRASGRAW